MVTATDSAAPAAPCGTWISPITPAALVAGAVGISEAVPTAEGSLWWAESRPDEGGRTVLMRHADGTTAEITPPSANVRTTVHEYGGGAWWASERVAWYVDHADQRLYRVVPGEDPVALSPAPDTPKALRYADFRPSSDGRWLIGVGERHVGAEEPLNTIVAIATDGSERLVTLLEGADFYGSPRLSPDGASLAWIEWDHPNMPWDDTTLRAAALVADADAIRVGEARTVAGGRQAGEAVVQPEWAPDGTLHYLSDRRDTWQLYREGVAEPVLTVAGEIGYPPWVFGLSRYAFRADGEVVAARFDGGVEFLDGYPGHTAFSAIRTAGEHLAFVAASWSAESAVVLDGRVVRAPRDLGLDPALLAPPERITFPTGGASSGEGSGEGVRHRDRPHRRRQ